MSYERGAWRKHAGPLASFLGFGSPDGAQRNPGLFSQAQPSDFAALHPGYGANSSLRAKRRNPARAKRAKQKALNSPLTPRFLFGALRAQLDCFVAALLAMTT
jgi:hypothetical protein